MMEAPRLLRGGKEQSPKKGVHRLRMPTMDCIMNRLSGLGTHALSSRPPRRPYPVGNQ